MGATMPGYPIDQIQFLHRAGWLGHGGIVALTRVYLKLEPPEDRRSSAPARPAGAHGARVAVAPAGTAQNLKRHREEVEGDLTEGELRPAE